MNMLKPVIEFLEVLGLFACANRNKRTIFYVKFVIFYLLIHNFIFKEKEKKIK